MEFYPYDLGSALSSTLTESTCHKNLVLRSHPSYHLQSFYRQGTVQVVQPTPTRPVASLWQPFSNSKPPSAAKGAGAMAPKRAAAVDVLARKGATAGKVEEVGIFQYKRPPKTFKHIQTIKLISYVHHFMNNNDLI